MKKHFAVSALLLGFLTIASAQIRFFPATTNPPFSYEAHEGTLLPPEPMTPTALDISRAGWMHFTMFSNGLFSSKEVVKITFGSPGTNTVLKDRKGKYTKQNNPPHTSNSVVIPPTTLLPIPHVDDPFSLRASQIDSIHPEWGAAALSDTHYFALVLKNTSTTTQSGSLKLRFPTNAFDYIGTVFEPNTASFGGVESDTDDGDEIYPPGTIYTWPVTNLPPLDSQTIFVRLRVKDNVADNNQLIQLSSDLSTAAIFQNNTPATPFIIKTDSGSESRVQNPYNFRETNSTNVTLNAARDPNSLIAFPKRLPPAKNAPSHTLRYTVNVENLGTALARIILVEIPFTDSRIKTGMPITLQSVHFPNGGGGLESAGPFSVTAPSWNGTTLKMEFKNANLAPDEQGYFSKASFDFEITTKENIELKEGDVISAKALIIMKSSAASNDDSVWTDPALVRIERPGRVPFGCIWGIKGHTNAFSPDSAMQLRGIDLTFRFPIVKRRLARLSDSGVLPPRLFWQLEAGWGASTFNHPNEGGLFEAQYIHFTPVLIRYFHPVFLNPYMGYAGLSAGYSAGYVYTGKFNGQKATLPSGFGKKLEHELAVSIDVSNRIDVPTVTFGLGYKYRWNNLLGQSVNYSTPFVYLQLDIVQFSRRFTRIWTKTIYH